MSPQARSITDEVVFREVSARFAAEPPFRAQLKSDAAQTLEALGIEVPSGVLVQVESHPPDSDCLVVYGAENSELTDGDMEKVAGGVGAIPRADGSFLQLRLRRPVVFCDEIAYNTGSF